MPLKWKIDVIGALKSNGYNTGRIRSEKILSESTLQKLRTKDGLSWSNIETICRLLDCQPGDLIEYTSDCESKELAARGFGISDPGQEQE